MFDYHEDDDNIGEKYKYTVHPNRLAKMELLLTIVRERSGGAEIRIEFASNVYSYATIRLFGKRFIELLKSVITNSRKSIAEYEILNRYDLEQIERINQNNINPPSEDLLAALKRHARFNGDKIAYVDDENNISYSDLCDLVNTLAKSLQKRGLEHKYVILHVNRKMESVTKPL